jgi:hypothetical protein
MPGQFDPMQIYFMLSMRPMAKNLNKTGKPDWDEPEKS